MPGNFREFRKTSIVRKPKKMTFLRTNNLFSYFCLLSFFKSSNVSTRQDSKYLIYSKNMRRYLDQIWSVIFDLDLNDFWGKLEGQITLFGSKFKFNVRNRVLRQNLIFDFFFTTYEYLYKTSRISRFLMKITVDESQ